MGKIPSVCLNPAEAMMYPWMCSGSSGSQEMVNMFARPTSTGKRKDGTGFGNSLLENNTAVRPKVRAQYSSAISTLRPQGMYEVAHSNTASLTAMNQNVTYGPIAVNQGRMSIADAAQDLGILDSPLGGRPLRDTFMGTCDGNAEEMVRMKMVYQYSVCVSAVL
jgi:hypothetical protein